MSRPDVDEVSDDQLVQHIWTYLGCTEEISREFLRISVLEDARTFDKKQRDYGPRNIATFMEVGVLVRVSDKVARLVNLIWMRESEPENESIEDSWRDLSVYSVIARLCRRGKWSVSE
tara:strand:+ start:6194 stop:6547 length:354 start_codon:yes stop_codon:yes gene_type:complete